MENDIYVTSLQSQSVQKRKQIFRRRGRRILAVYAAATLLWFIYLIAVAKL